MNRVLLTALILLTSPAVAQPNTYVFLDMGWESADAGHDDDAGASDDGLIIEYGNYVPPQPVRPPPPPTNPRTAYADAVTARAKHCIAAHAVDTTRIDITFTYDFRELATVAKLARTTDAETILIPWLYVALLQSVGDGRAINTRAAYAAFQRCATDVALPTAVATSESLTFRIRRGVKKLYVRDLRWHP